MLNINAKFLSKAISNKLNDVLPTLGSSQQTAPVKNIGESCRIISDITEINHWFNFEEFLVTTDVEKVFKSLDLDFLSSVLWKFGFDKNFITWIDYLID